MKSPRILPFTLLFATTTVFGQGVLQGGPALSGPPIVRGIECPVGLQVDYGPSFQERAVGVEQSSGLVQRIRLTMTNPQPRTIVGAQLTAHGYSQKLRFTDVSTAVADLAKTIQLALEVRTNGQVYRDVSLSRFAAVTAVDLNAVEYADGSSWHERAPGACSVAPSLMRLVRDSQ